MNRLETLDQELAHLKTASAAALANICALYEHPVYRTLSGKLPGKPVALTGDSHVRAEKAVSSIGTLLILISNLTGTIEQAAKLRSSIPMLFNSDRVEEIERLLRGPSVVLPPPDATPLAARRLLDDTEPAPTMLAPAQVLEMMQPEFEFARDTIFAVNRAWTDMSTELDVSEGEIASLEGLAANVGLDESSAARAALAELRLSIEGMRGGLRNDPLRATESLEKKLLPRLAAVRADLEQAAREREETKGELGAARTLARQLLEVHAQAYAASEDCGRKIQIEPLPPQPLAEPEFDALGKWLDRLATPIESSGDWRAARIGLKRWQAQAEITLSADRAAREAAETLLRERLTLRGWLDALHAKAELSALSEDAELAEAFGQARQLLQSRPTPMVPARECVARYQALINARIGKR